MSKSNSIYTAASRGKGENINMIKDVKGKKQKDSQGNTWITYNDTQKEPKVIIKKEGEKLKNDHN